jgi:hypothetical protein
MAFSAGERECAGDEGEGNKTGVPERQLPGPVPGELEVEDGDEKMTAAGDCDDGLRTVAVFCAGSDIDG